jgi:hypothetical protein
MSLASRKQVGIEVVTEKIPAKNVSWHKNLNSRKRASAFVTSYHVSFYNIDLVKLNRGLVPSNGILKDYHEVVTCVVHSISQKATAAVFLGPWQEYFCTEFRCARRAALINFYDIGLAG